MLWTGLKTAIIPLIIAILPINDANIKILLLAFLNEIFSLEALVLFSRFGMCRKRQIYINNRLDNGCINILFNRAQDYIAFKFIDVIESCEIVTKNGNVEFSLTDMMGKRFHDAFQDHEIDLHIEDVISLSKSKNFRSLKRIVIESKTASSEEIKQYVKFITTKQIAHDNIIEVYRPVSQGAKKDDRKVEWEHIYVKTNKTLRNTFYSKEIEEELFEDIERFIRSEEDYAVKGIPYKRGFLLHSKPGQGKTSVPKILAAKYDIPVFVFDMNIIVENDTLTRLATEINIYTENGKYIMLIEDTDHINFFVDEYIRTIHVSLDCLLNVLDGVAESQGRLLIVTANNPEYIQKIGPMMRPGRIDKVLEIKFFDLYQISKAIKIFYNEEPDLSKWKFSEQISGSQIIKYYQESKNVSEFLSKIATENEEEAPPKQPEIEDKPENSFGGRRRRQSSKKLSTKQKLNYRLGRKKKEVKRLEKSTAQLVVLEEKLSTEKERLRLQNIRKSLVKKKAKLEAKVSDEVDAEDAGLRPPAFLANTIEVDEIPENDQYTLLMADEDDPEKIPLGTLFK